MLSLARGSFWYKCPFVPLIVRNFSPLPPSPSSHTHSTSFTRTHTIPSYHEQVSYERRNHLRLFRLGLTRVLSFDFVVWMGHLNTIPNCHSGTYSIWGLTISLKIKNFRVEILEKNPSPWDDSNTFWRRPRAKNPTLILVREKKSALLACLWLSSISKTHVAIVMKWCTYCKRYRIYIYIYIMHTYIKCIYIYMIIIQLLCALAFKFLVNMPHKSACFFPWFNWNPQRFEESSNSHQPW